jgi:hypothetical protein
MEKKPREAKRPLTPEEVTDLNAQWDKTAAEIRADLEAKTLMPEKAVIMGIMFDAASVDAKTEYIQRGMLTIAMELVTFLASQPLPEGADIPAEIIEQKDKHAADAIEEYKRRIAKLDAPAIAAKAEAEKAHVSAEAGGIFANVSMADIMGTKPAEGLPNF